MLPLEKQCISLEYAEKLKELGVKQDSYFYYWKNHVGHLELSSIDDEDLRLLSLRTSVCPRWSAFNAVELGVMLPKEWGTIKGLVESEWECHTIRKNESLPKMNVFTMVDSEANCRA